MRIYVSTVVLVAFGLLGACRQGGLYPDGEIGNDAERPEYGDPDDVAPYAVLIVRRCRSWVSTRSTEGRGEDECGTPAQ